MPSNHHHLSRRLKRTLLVGVLAAAAGVGAVPFGSARAATTPEVQPTPASAMSLPASLTLSTAAQRKLPADHFSIGTRDRLLTTGKLVWLPTVGVPFDSVYQYASGTGPGTPGDAHVSTMLAWAQKTQLLNTLPVISYMRINGNYWGPTSRAAACTGTCAQGDTAKRNLDHLNDPSFMQEYFKGLVDLYRSLDASYTGQFVLHFEPDLNGYAQQLSIDRTRCAADCISGTGADDPRGVRAAVASSGISQLSRFPNTLQGFYSAVLWLRDTYAPRVSLAYHVSNWATASTNRVDNKNQTANSITNGTTPVDAAALGRRVAAFATLNGASATPAPLPGGTTSHFDLIYNDILDNDAGYFSTVLNHPEYWWDSENITLPNFARWETYLGAIISATKLPTTVWQVPIGNTIYRVENNTLGHYQDNRLQYFFDHLQELKAIGVTGLIFGSSEKSTWGADNQLDVTDNSRTVCTNLGTASQKLQCPTLDATLTDDDGGYFRQRAAAYFQNPLPLT